MRPALGALLALVVATQSACGLHGGAGRSLSQRETTGLTFIGLGLGAVVAGGVLFARGQDQAEEDSMNGFGGLLDAGGDLRALAGLTLAAGGLAGIIGSGILMAEPDPPARVRSPQQAVAAPWPIRMRGTAIPATPARQVAYGERGGARCLVGPPASAVVAELTDLPFRDAVEDKPVLSGVPAVLADPREAGFVLPSNL